MRSARHIDNTLAKRKELTEIALIAILIGFGTGATASAFISYADIPELSKYIVSLLAAVTGILILVRGLASGLNFRQVIEANFLADECNKIIPIRNYKFSEELSSIFKAVFQESKALEKLWYERENIAPDKGSKEGKEVDLQAVGRKKPDTEDKPTYLAICRVEVDEDHETRYKKHGDLLKEVVEFILLEQLSLHLSSYFMDREGDEEIREYKRSDTTDFLLKNRIFSILTKPIEDRDIFLDAFPDPNHRPEGEIHQLWSSNGAMYKKFELLLPKGTKVSKTPDGFKLENNRIEICAEVIFNNFNAAIERSFIRNYVRANPDSSSAYTLKIIISGEIKPLSLLSGKGWVYYQWLDTFLEKAEKNLSFEHFLKRINWPHLSAAIHVENNRMRIAGKVSPIKPGARSDNTDGR